MPIYLSQQITDMYKARNGEACPDKKENQIFLIYKEIQSGAVAKSYMRKGFLIYEEMRKYFPIHEEAVGHLLLCNCSILNFLIYEENFFFFYQFACLICPWHISLDAFMVASRSEALALSSSIVLFILPI